MIFIYVLIEFSDELKWCEVLVVDEIDVDDDDVDDEMLWYWWCCEVDDEKKLSQN